MDGGIIEPIVTPIDIRCRRADCSCVRSVSGNILDGGGYEVAPEAGPICSVCNHSWKNHDVLGQSKSDAERRNT